MALPPPHLKARKRFGQNFLIDDYIIGSIVNAINPKPGQYLVEIGPGHAALTRPVLERAGALTAIELDRDLADILRHDPFLKGLTLIEGDALKVDFAALPGAGQLRVFGNLPYNITSPLIFHLLEQPGIMDMHFMLQKEVVERLAAGPHSKEYGRLTVMAQFYAEVIPVLEVPPTAFRPRPKVDSAVVRLLPKALSPELKALAPYLNQTLAAAFSARRKTLRNALQRLVPTELLTTLPCDLALRAEDLSLKDYIELATRIQTLAQQGLLLHSGTDNQDNDSNISNNPTAKPAEE
ncbi:MAG: 16S rRNA (adenine(1518)-N(6)/adenine(1519)-N(6))-dimethyltransferase RsmA [Candidatus Anaerobiospirillum merdipullorum]|uniref:Ribosomal RNA small subunit methyltransferase A n=1 Tax=Candidatus Anaerobiospirillum merdipullorum TaxID=2838450 RepID=A0A9E2NS75_9GAMM|nr:16S rRNA (adenine(1518)-N(6)/adenine(1519)-N(6))-dimethyltransferase RsmA [Candidatus Anaerobiospirillum merdipullorum]